MVEGAIHYHWFDDKEKDDNGQTEYDRALAGGWSKVHFNESKNFIFINGLFAPGETLSIHTLSPNGPDSSSIVTHNVTWREWATIAYASSKAGGISDELIREFFISRFADGMNAPQGPPSVSPPATGTQFKEPKPGLSGKEGAKDIPSWQEVSDRFRLRLAAISHGDFAMRSMVPTTITGDQALISASLKSLLTAHLGDPIQS